MKLWDFFTRHADVSLPRVIAVAAISGLSNALLLAVINKAAQVVEDGGVSWQMFGLFAIAIVLYIVSQRYILHVASVEVEKIIAKLRVSFGDKIRQADLDAIEGLGRAQIYAGVNTETLTISQAAAPLMIACQGAILVFFSLAYMYYLSGWAFVLTLVIVGIGVAIHFSNRRQLIGDLQASTTRENAFFDVLTDLLEGFKEVKLNQRRSNDLNQHLRSIAVEVAQLKTRTGIRYADYYIFTQVLFYLLIASMVFLLPAVSTVYSELVTRLTASVLFIIGPLTMVVGVLPVVETASNAVENIERLEAQLNRAQREALAKDNGRGASRLAAFGTIELAGVRYAYVDAGGQPLFTVGPLDMSVTAGETLFIIGGNGSGKSTLLKTLTGLYYPAAGHIFVDHVDVRTLGLQRYRELFSAIFSDYHLFHRVYGIDWESERVTELLALMRLGDKTSWMPDGFTNQNLSTGQRKRLALIISLLEDRPIYVFDEWAADQDPDFRQVFYDTLLPALKRQGKTIIATTHDDRFFNKADRVLKMELGRFVPYHGGDA
jgi:putative ATP-binding cassette transporter